MQSRRTRSSPVRSRKRPERGRAVDLGPLPGLIGYMLRRAQMTVFQDIFRVFSKVNIRPAQFSVLVVIEHNPGLTQSQVSAALGIKRTNFVALLDSLEQRRLAERRPSPGDRRSHALHLTDGGKAMMRRLRQLVSLLESRLVASLGEGGRDQLIELLHRLADGEYRGTAAKASARDGVGTMRQRRAQTRENRSMTSRGIG